MTRTATFRGTVTGGVLTDMVRRQIATFIRTLDTKRIVVTVALEADKRTMKQNDGFHASVIRPWALHLGYDPDELKRDLLGITFGWADSPLGENRTPLKPHTSALTVEEFSLLFDRAVIEAAKTGFQVILPDDYRERRWRVA